MKHTTIKIECLSQVSAETLKALGTVLFSAAEDLEQELEDRHELGIDDCLKWDISVEGPYWNFNAHGKVSHKRSTRTVTSREVIIRPVKIKVEEQESMLTLDGEIWQPRLNSLA